MPGVPSGRGCEGCRKQKKKCDEKRPSCSRCTRLHMECVGSGLRRYKFKESGFQRSQPLCPKNDGQALREGPRSGREESRTETLNPSMSNDITLLANAFINMIKPTTDFKYNLAWSYGDYLEEVPRRLGSNEALDASVDAVISAHASFCTHRMGSIDTLIKYSRALKELRICLDHPVKSRTSDTLCAVTLLLVCQSFMRNKGDQWWSGHAEGAVQILKARRYSRPQDDFENKLLRSLRGPVLFEGLFNSKIRLNSQEWKELVENELDGTSYEGQIMSSLLPVPGIIQRGKESGFEARLQDMELRYEAELLYENFKATLRQMAAQYAVIKTSTDAEEYPSMITLQCHAYYQRLYGLGLVVSIVLNHVLSAFYVDHHDLALESAYFSEEIIVLAEDAVRYRPLGAAYIVLCLMVAWTGTTDESSRRVIESGLLACQRDFVCLEMEDMFVKLNEMSRHLRMLETAG